MFICKEYLVQVLLILLKRIYFKRTVEFDKCADFKYNLLIYDKTICLSLSQEYLFKSAVGGSPGRAEVTTSSIIMVMENQRAWRH